MVEQGAQRGGDLGRPGTALTLARDGMAGLGLEVNVDYLAACVVDLARRTRVQFVEVGDNRPATRRPWSSSWCGWAAVAAAGTQGLTISATCVAVPGLVDQETGTVVRAPNLDWSGVPLRRRPGRARRRRPGPGRERGQRGLARRAVVGDGAAFGDYVHISGEVGVGAGIVVAGQFRGAHGHAGELGHTTLEPDGAVCTCGGRGCLELFCGQEAILRRAGLDPAVSTSTGRSDGPVSVLVDRLAAGDPRAVAACEVAGRSLGMATASLVKLVDPDTVVLGGIYAVLAPWLRAPFQEALLDGIPMTRAAPPRSPSRPSARTRPPAGRPGWSPRACWPARVRSCPLRRGRSINPCRSSSLVRCCATSARPRPPSGSRPTPRPRSRCWSRRVGARRAPTFRVEGHHYALVLIEGLEPGPGLRVRGPARRRARVAAAGRRRPGRAPLPAQHHPHAPRRPPAADRLRVLPGRRPPPAAVEPAADRRPQARQGGGRPVHVRPAHARRRPGHLARPPLLLGDQIYADDTSEEVQAFIRSRRDVKQPPGLEVADFEEYTRLYWETWGDPVLRWLLSTVPTAMIFDDHDISDDWNTSAAWVDHMRAMPWWEERITSGLASYWLYQHLGNLSPDDLDDDPVWPKVREAGDATRVLREFAAGPTRRSRGPAGATSATSARPGWW